MHFHKVYRLENNLLLYGTIELFQFRGGMLTIISQWGGIMSGLQSYYQHLLFCTPSKDVQQDQNSIVEKL